MKVAEILQVKGNILYTVASDLSLMHAVDLMQDKDIGSLVVIHHGGVAGILTFREVIKAIYQHGGSLKEAGGVERFMVAPVIVTPESDLDEIRRVMLEKHARYLLVMQDETLLGVISFYDVAKTILEAQSFENKMLKAYIQDSSMLDE